MCLSHSLTHIFTNAHGGVHYTSIFQPFTRLTPLRPGKVRLACLLACFYSTSTWLTADGGGLKSRRQGRRERKKTALLYILQKMENRGTDFSKCVSQSSSLSSSQYTRLVVLLSSTWCACVRVSLISLLPSSLFFLRLTLHSSFWVPASLRWLQCTVRE